MKEGIPNSQEQSKNNFEYISIERTKYLLDSFGYGKKMMYVDAFYFDRNAKSGVGVVEASAHRCEGHNGVFRGVDIIEATAQTRLLLDKMIYAEEGKIPLFRRVLDFEFNSPVPVGGILNIHIDKNEDVKTATGIISTGRIYLGDSLVSQGKVEGTVVDKAFFDKFLERETRKATKKIPRYSIIF